MFGKILSDRGTILLGRAARQLQFLYTENGLKFIWARFIKLSELIWILFGRCGPKQKYFVLKTNPIQDEMHIFFEIRVKE